MIDDSKEQYLKWQTRLRIDKRFRYWWQFWGNYSAVFFAIAAVTLIGSSIFWDVVGLSISAFLLSRLVIINIINHYYKRQRPYHLYFLNPITSRFFSGTSDTPNSFPSRHTAAVSAVAWVFVVLVPELGWPLIGVALLTCAARVVLGFHFRSDVIAGFVVGLISAYLSLQVWSLLIFT